MKIKKPQGEEYNPNIVPYINLIPGDGQLIKHQANNLKKIESFILSIPRKKLQYRYAENKWTMNAFMYTELYE